MDSADPQPATASPEWFDDSRRNWYDRAAVHVASGYGIQDLIDAPQAIPDTLAPGLPHLGDLTGASLIHLQCHLGTDTIGFKRQDAGRVVGVDLSGESLHRARQLSAECRADIEYVEPNVYAARAAIDGEFDVVFSTLGVLCGYPMSPPGHRS